MGAAARNDTKAMTCDTLAGNAMKLEIETGRILGAKAAAGPILTVART